MDKARERHVTEMNRLKEALRKTKSDYLRRDYKKALRKMQAELKEYDEYRKQHEA